MDEWPEPVERVAAVVRARGIDARLEEFPEGTPTAAAAARAVGCVPVPNISRVLFERGLLEWELVWAGAGSETHMLGISPIDLARVTQAEIVDIVEA